MLPLPLENGSFEEHTLIFACTWMACQVAVSPQHYVAVSSVGVSLGYCYRDRKTHLSSSPEWIILHKRHFFILNGALNGNSFEELDIN